jgi:type IV pilus assembly protein PilC
MTLSDKHARHVHFWKKYLRLTRGGVSVLRALDIIRREETDATFRDVIGKLLQAVEGGSTLSEATAACSSEFSLSVVELISAAESRGAWDEIIQEIIDGLQDGTFD